MDNPIKKKSLIPRMFRAFTFYFFITLAVFFGYVELFGGVKTINGSLPENGAQGEVDTSFSDFVTNMMSMQNIYVEDLQFSFEGSGMSISANANVAVDMATKQIALDAKVNVNGHLYDLGVVYSEPEVFVSVDDKTYRFVTTTEEGAFDVDFASLMKLFAEVSKNINIDTSGIEKVLATLGIDLENLNMSTIIDQLDISTKKTEGEVRISIIAFNHVEVMIVCDENCVMQSANVKGVNIGSNALVVNVPKVEMNNVAISEKFKAPTDENIIDMSPINDYVVYTQNFFKNEYVEVDVLVDVAGKTYDAKLNLDNSDKTKLKISTEVEGYEVSVVYADETFFVNVDDYGVSISVQDLKVWKDRILSIIEEKASKSVTELLNELLDKYINTEDSKDFVKKLQEFVKNLVSCSENISVVLPSEAVNSEDKFALAWDDGLVIELLKQDKMLSGLTVLCKDVAINVDFKVVDFGVEAPTNCEDLSRVLAKLDNLLSYIESGIFEFDFNANYNGLNFAGNFKYANGIFEISDVLAAGEIANIRIENGFVYFSYGNMKLKFVVPENDESEESVNFRETLSKIMSDSLGVEINFGEFEELLNMLVNYTTEDWKTKLVLGVSGNQDDVTLTASNKNENGLSKILTANVTFTNDKIDTAKVSLYDILKADIKVDYVQESTIKPFDEEEYKDYSTDFMAGALDSLEVVPNVYGFSSDVAIRYSKTTFYGEVVAMLVKDENNPASIGGYLPAVSIHTTSLGLNSYIYLIGKTAYIDINGLQICADLEQTTIEEVLQFVEQKFGMSLAGEGSALASGAMALKVILPAIDKIYGSWITESGNGIQIDIDDALWYGKESRFEDIVLQAFIVNSNNIIMPSKVVVGANIYDPNTLVYDDYSDAWLYAGIDEAGNKMIIEDSITKNLNFGAYFTNISVGAFAESIDRVFAIEDRNYQNLTSVMSNYGVTNLSDFNSYKTVLTLAETVYDYGMSMNYQISINASMSDETSNMNLGGDVIISVDELKEGQSSALDLFGGKSLKVQGNLDLNNNGTQHLVDILYSNVDEGLYLTYTHGANIEKGNKLKAKIANTNMSEIISMIVKFANLGLSDSMKEAWNIDYCTTDFSYIQSLLGIGETEIGDEISKADVALNSVENITKLLGLIKLDKVLGEDGLNTTTLSAELKLNEGVAPAKVSIVLREEKNGDLIVTKLRQIAIDNFVFGGKEISVVIDVQDFDAANFDYDTTASHIDFSDITEIVDSAVNTANQKELAYEGNLLVDLGSFGKIELANLKLYFKLPNPDTKEKPYLLAEYDIKADSVAAVMIEGSDSKKRSAIVEYKDGRISVVETFVKVLTSKTEYKTASFELSELRNTDNLKKVMYTALGLNSTGKGIIDIVLNNVTFPTPMIEQLITGFTSNEGVYGLELDGKHLTGMDDSDIFKIKLVDSKNYEVEVGNLEMLEDAGFVDENGNYKSYTSVVKFLEQITCDANDKPLKASIATISFNLKASKDKISFLDYSSDGLSLGGNTIPSNETFRENYLNSVRNPWGWKPISYHTISFDTDSENNSISNIESFYGDKVVLPQLLLKQETEGDVTTNYEFDGWYNEKGVEVGDTIVLTENIKLTARWIFKNQEITKSLKVYDAENKSNLLYEKRIKAGDEISLDDWLGRDADWVYVDENGQKVDLLNGMLMPENDLIVYKKDRHSLTINYKEIVNGSPVDKQIQVYLYTGENFLSNIPTNENDNSGFYTNLNGDIINFENFKFVSEKTGWFVDSTYTTPLTDFVMPNQDFEVFAKGEYFDITLYHNGNLVANETLMKGQQFNVKNFNYSGIGDRTVFFSDAEFKNQISNVVVTASQNQNFYMKNKYTITFNLLDTDVSLQISPKKDEARLVVNGVKTTQTSYEFFEGDVDLTNYVGWCKYNLWGLNYYYIFNGWKNATNNHYNLTSDVTLMASFQSAKHDKNGYDAY